MDAELSEEVVIESYELNLTHSREELALFYGVERVVDSQFSASTGHSTRRHYNNFDAILPEPCNLVNKC